MESVTFVWNTFLVHPLINGLVYIADNLGLGAGLAIVFFTILIRLVLLPLSLKGTRSMKAMQAMQPKVAALKKKYGDDKQKVQAETMKLYREEGVNPLGGCLPLLLQMPFFFAFYHALINLGNTENEMFNPIFQEGFLWVENLSEADVMSKQEWLAALFPAIASPDFLPLPYLLPLLAGGTQWVQQRMMTTPSSDPQQRLQQQMMMFMPLMIIVIGVSFGAGLALYWVVQNLFGIVQQYFVSGLGALDADVQAVAVRLRGFMGSEAGTGTGSESGTAPSMTGAGGRAVDSRANENGGSREAGRDSPAMPAATRGGLDGGWRAGLRRLLGTAEPEVTEARNEPSERPPERRRSSRRRRGRRARGKR